MREGYSRLTLAISTNAKRDLEEEWAGSNYQGIKLVDLGVNLSTLDHCFKALP